MQAAVLEKASQGGALDGDRLSAVLLVHVAGAGRGTAKSEIADSLYRLVAHTLPAPRWLALFDREIESLAAAGLIVTTAGSVAASPAGAARAAIFLGLKGGLPRSGADLVNVRLVAK